MVLRPFLFPESIRTVRIPIPRIHPDCPYSHSHNLSRLSVFLFPESIQSPQSLSQNLSRLSVFLFPESILTICIPGPVRIHPDSLYSYSQNLSRLSVVLVLSLVLSGVYSSSDQPIGSLYHWDHSTSQGTDNLGGCFIL